MKKNFFILILICFTLIGCSNQISETFTVDNIEIGSYITFGKYQKSPIVWRVIHKYDDNTLLLWSDNIIKMGPFDSPGDFFNDSTRKDYGSNNWKDSNIRQWLNSDDKSGEINWIQNPPSPQNLVIRELSYYSEAGFLNNKNFNDYEKSLIQNTSHKVLVPELEINNSDGGNILLTIDSKDNIDLKNYDNAYYQIITDKIFLLSIKEVDEYIFNNEIIHSDYAIGYPSESFIDNLFTEDTANFKTTIPLMTWLRTPYDKNNTSMLTTDGTISGIIPSAELWMGFRPAVTIDETLLYFSQGDGSSDSPYIISQPSI